jgi:S1-C subfamily serine protease
MNTTEPRRRTAAAVLAMAITAGSAAGALSAAALINANPTPSQAAASLGASTVSYDTTDLEKAITHVAATASPSVVQVLAQVSLGGPFGGSGESSGSGFVVDASGLIVTSRHVVNGATAIEVVLADTTRLTATVVATDTVNDLAVLRVSADHLSALSVAPEGPGIGQTVIAIGTPLGEFPNSVTVGVVSGLDRSVDVGSTRSSQHLTGVFQTDAALSSGMSGGPILNVAGQVVGVTTAVAESAQGVGFAEPAAAVAALLARV